MKKLDFITYSPKIQFEQDEGIKTVFGSILTILICIISIFSFAAFGKDLVLKKAPITRYSSEIVTNLTLKNSDVFIPLGFFKKSSSGPIVDFNRRLEVLYGKFDVNNERPLAIFYQFFKGVQCDKYSKQFIENKDNVQSYLAGPADGYWCPPEEFRSNIAGVYGSNKAISWDIHVRSCVNTTENKNHCFPKEDNDEYLKLFITHLVIPSNLINPLDLDNPIKPIFNTKWARTSTHMSRQEILFYKKVNFVSDEGFILESLQKKESFQFLNYESDIFPMINPIPILRLIVSLSSERGIINREYVKIQKVAADVGGIIEFVLLLSIFLNQHVGKVIFLERYINKVIEEKTIRSKSITISCKTPNNLFKVKEKSTVKRHKRNAEISPQKNKIKEDSFSKLARFKNENKMINTNSLFDWIKLIRTYYCCVKNNNTHHLLDNFFNNEYSFESIIQLKSHIEFLCQSHNNFNDALNSYNSKLVNMFLPS